MNTFITRLLYPARHKKPSPLSACESPKSKVQDPKSWVWLAPKLWSLDSAIRPTLQRFLCVLSVLLRLTRAVTKWRRIAEFLALRRNTSLLLVALVLAGTGEKLWLGFMPEYLLR